MSAFTPADRPQRVEPEYAIIRIVNSGTFTFVVLGHKLEGFQMHWDGSKTVPCFASQSSCPYCKRGCPQRWKGYLHVFCFNTHREGFLELTPTGAEQFCFPLTADSSVRGVRFNAARANGAKTARLKLQFLPNESDLAKLPEPKSVVRTLEKVFAVNTSDN